MNPAPSAPRARRALLLLPLALLACRAADSTAEDRLAVAPAKVPEPMRLEGKAYDSAALRKLPEQAPEERHGLHNVFHLSDTIVSGSEPHGREALEELRAMGIRTIVSVDGKEPEAAAAAELGMRYVHVPIQYAGFREDEVLKLSKTFRELESPFYVHCFHGKHRGPAAAAVGRVVLDGVPRDQAIAEMRQYCGTSSKYEGLYHDIATGHLPEESETRAFHYGFDPVKRPAGVVGTMVKVSRAHDNVVDLLDRDWQVDPAHPDVDPLNEARILHQAFAGALELDAVKTGPADAREGYAASRAESARLVEWLERLRSGESAAGVDAGQQAAQSFAALKQLCADCHAKHRN